MRYIPAIILTFILASAPLSAQRVVEEIIAWVNAEIILKSEYEAELTKIRDMLAAEGVQGGQLQQRMAEFQPNLLRDMIDQSLLVQKAREMDLNADIDVLRTLERLRQDNNFPTMEALYAAIEQQGSSIEEFREDIRNQYLTGQVIGREVDRRITVTTEEMRNYYEGNKQDFDRPEGIQISEITILAPDRTPEEVERQRNRAEEALAAIRGGEPFADVALSYSDSATAQEGGLLGFFEKGQLNPFLEEAAAQLERGQVSEVLTLSDGFMIIRVDDKHTGGILPFEIAQDEIANMIWRERREPRIREYLTQLRTEGFVRVAEGYVDTGAASSFSVSNPEK